MKHYLFLFLLGTPLFIIGCKTATESQPVVVKQGISGTVCASGSNVPISGATARLSAPDSIQTTTNGSGVYGFDNVPVGDYKVYFSAAGYGTSKQPVHVDSGSKSILNVSLTSQNDLAILNFHVQN